MPSIYLSPSLQPWNPTVLGVSEQFLMGLIADAIEPILRLNNIDFTRSREGMNLNQVIAESNAGNFDAHIAIHSNAAPTPGTARGSRQYFFTNSERGRRLAQFFANELATIYPDPTRVTINPTTALAELRGTRAPAVVSEVAFHDNAMDAEWIANNIQNIAEAIVRAITAFLGLDYIAPCAGTTGTQAANTEFNRFMWAQVCTGGASLNIRNAPNGEVLFAVADGTRLVITGGVQDGFVPVRLNMRSGFASAQFICICPDRIEGMMPTLPPVGPPVTPVPPIGITPPTVTPVPPIGIIPPPITPVPPIGVLPPPPPAPVPPIGIVPPVYPPLPPFPPVVTPPGECGIQPSMACLAQVRTQGGNLHLRSGPDTQANIIARMPNGSRILVLGEDIGWYYVFWNNMFGWASADYVQFY